MDSLRQDVRHGLRHLSRQPSVTILAILTLALGVGVSTALFSVIDAALLRPLPYPNPEELVTLDVEEMRAGEPSRYAPSMTDLRIWRTLTTIVAHAGAGRVTGFGRLIVDTGTPERLIVGEASEDFLETYGIVPMLGRGFDLDDMREGAPAVALLGHGYWQRTFGGDRLVLGRTIRIEDRPTTIVGVLPAGFYRDTAVWRPRQISAAMAERRGSGTPAIARLRPGVTLTQARAALDAVTPASAQPATASIRVVMQSMYEQETRSFGATIQTLSIAVTLILIIACVNVAGLTLAQGASRHVELAIRAAVGAGRARLIRQLLVESLLVAAAGAVVGVLLAYVSLNSLVALIPLSLPANSPVALNVVVLGFALGLTLVTAILSGLLPALALSRTPLLISSVLAAGGRHGAPLSKRAGQWLIAVEVALALVLMTGAGLILRSFAKLVAVDPGFSVDAVLTFEVEPLDQTEAARRAYYRSFLETLRQRPDILSAGAIDDLALNGGRSFSSTTAETGVSFDGPQRVVLPGYFDTIGVRPLAGRLFEDADLRVGEAVVLNDSAAQRYFDGLAIGRTLRKTDKSGRLFRVVGVVPDLRHGSPVRAVGPEMYVMPDPNSAGPRSRDAMTMVMRVRAGASLSLQQLEQAAESVGPRVLVGRLRPATEILSQHVVQPKNRMLLLTLLSAFGLLLTVVGIFSMTAYAVARRTREIGVRVACGAGPTAVVAAMLEDAAWPVALGLLVGLAGTYYATRLVTSFLFQTTPHDPLTLGAVVALLAAAAGVAAWLPARRAASIESGGGPENRLTRAASLGAGNLETAMRHLFAVIAIVLVTDATPAAQSGVLFRDEFTTVGPRLDRSVWTTEFGDPSFLGRTQLADWVTPGGVGQFVVDGGGAQLTLNTFNPTGFSLYGTHAKSLRSFRPSTTSTIELTTRLQLTSIAPGLVYGTYFYGCQTACAAQHDEIDIELVTNLLQPGAPLRVQLNRYAGEPLGPGNGVLADLPAGFDPLAPHDWTIRWSLSRVDYFVDGVLLYSATTRVPQGPMQVNVIAWGPGPEWALAYSPTLQPVGSSAQNTASISRLRSVIVREIQGVPPPTAFGVAAAAAGSTLQVSWALSPSAVALSGHQLTFYSGGAAAIGPATRLLQVVTGPQPQASLGIPAGTQGTFAVTVAAMSGAETGLTSAPATFVVGTGGCTGPPPTPSGLTGSRIAGIATIRWNAAPGATSYLVQAGSSAGGSNLFNGSLPATTAAGALDPSIPLFVRVSAENACGRSAPSADLPLPSVG